VEGGSRTTQVLKRTADSLRFCGSAATTLCEAISPSIGSAPHRPRKISIAKTEDKSLSLGRSVGVLRRPFQVMKRCKDDLSGVWICLEQCRVPGGKHDLFDYLGAEPLNIVD
jgi:hypothetical protein